MRIRRIIPGLLFVTLVLAAPLFSAGRSTPEPNVVLSNVIVKLDHQAVGTEAQALLADLIEQEYGTHDDELKWGMVHKLGWGNMTALAYIQYTTGKSFADMIQEGAAYDFWAYAGNAGMTCEKMVLALVDFSKLAERERNTRIFDKLRATRRVHALPDLGTGFGLFQEALDFRHINIPQTTKIHDVPGELAKEGQ